jgi:GntR family transcriptional regulator
LNLIVSYFSQTPIYEQIREQIKELILNGGLKAGEQLPSIRLMAKDLKVSVITVKRAYDELEREKVVEMLPGRGCFISQLNLDAIRRVNLDMLRERLSDIVTFANSCGVTQARVIEIINQIYGGGKDIER